MPTARIIDEDNNLVREVVLTEAPELNEVLTLEDGLMYEVVNIAGDQPELRNIQIEEDWGQ